MGFYGGKPGKNFVISKIFNHFGEMYDEAASSSVNNYFGSVAPGSFVLISYGALESSEYYSNIEAENTWFQNHGQVSRDVGLRDYMATVWNTADQDGTTDYNASLWVKTFVNNSFKYKYVGSLEGIYPQIINNEWTIGGEKTGIIAKGSAIQLKVVYDTSSGTNQLSDDYIYYKYDTEGEDKWRPLVELKGLTNLEQYASIAGTYAATAMSYANGTGGIDRGVDSEGKKIDETTANAKYYMETTKTLADGAKESITDISSNLADSKSMLQSVIDERTNFENLINNAPWGTMGDGEVIQARAGAPTLNDRLNLFPYQFDLQSDLIACKILKPEDTAIVFGIDDIGDTNSTLFRIYRDDNDPKIAEDLTLDSETKKYVMQLPGGSTKDSTKLTLLNGYIAYSIAIFSGVGTGGGSGGSTVGSLSCTFDQTTITSGGTATITYYWTSPNAGQGRLYVVDNNVNIIDGQYVKQGTNTFDWSPADGKHTLKIYVIDRGNLYTNDVTLIITAGGVSISSSFVDGTSKNTASVMQMRIDISTIYTQDPVNINYTVKGPSYPTGQTFTVINSTVGKSRSTVLNFNSSPKLAAGAYTVSIQAESNGYTSNILNKSFVLAASNIIYVSSLYDSTLQNQEGSLITIPYNVTLLNGTKGYVYYYICGGDITISDSDTKKTFNGVVYKQLGQPSQINIALAENSYKTTKLKASSNPYYFMIEVYDYSTGSIDSNTKYGCLNEPIEISVVAAANKEIQLNQDGLIYYYDSRQGQQNSDYTKSVWENMSTSPSVDSKVLNLYNFNWATNGWNITDYNNNSVEGLRFDGNAYASLKDNTLFQSVNTDGLTIDALFKPYDLGSESRILEYAFNEDTNQGIWITQDSAHIVSSNGEHIHVAFNSDNLIRITFVIDPYDAAYESEASDENDVKLGFMKIYINGVCCAAKKFDSGFNLESAFGGTLYINRSRDSKNLRLGYCDWYSLRIHNKAMSSEAVLQNHIYDISDPDVQKAKWIKNNYSTVESSLMPTIEFYTTPESFSAMTKEDKIKMKVVYTPDPSDLEKTQTWENCDVCWQGTSSIAYPIKNFKIKTKNAEGKKVKYQIDAGKCKAESTFCLKADYMDSSHCHNTGNANFFNDTGILTNYTLTPPQCLDGGLTSYRKEDGSPQTLADTGKSSLEIRNSIYGKPCQLLIYYGTTNADGSITYGDPTFAGLYNFNIDKGCFSTFGLYRANKTTEIFPQCTSFEVVANSNSSAGAFKKRQFVTNGTAYGYTNLNTKYVQSIKKDSAGTITYDYLINPSGTYIEITPAGSDGILTGGAVTYLLASEWTEVTTIPDTAESAFRTYYEQDFEIRYPDAEEYEITADSGQYNERYYKEYDKVRKLVEWVNDAEISYVTDSQGNTSIDPKCKFYSEFEQHFDLDTITNYYIFVLMTGLIDNLGKNLMINTWGTAHDGSIPFLKNGDYNRLYHFDVESNTFHYGLTNLNEKYNVDGVLDASGKYCKIYSCDKDGKYTSLTESTFDTLTNGLYLISNIDTPYDWENKKYYWEKVVDDSNIIWYTHPYDLDSCLGCDNMGYLRYHSDIEILPTTGNIYSNPCVTGNGNGYIDYENTTFYQGGSPFNTYLSNLWSKFQTAFIDKIKSRYKKLRTSILTNSKMKEFYYTNQIEKNGERMYNRDAYAKYLAKKAAKTWDPSDPKADADGWVYKSPQAFDFMLHGHDWERLSNWIDSRLFYLDSLYEYGSSYNNKTIIARSTVTGTFSFSITTYRSQYVRISWANKSDNASQAATTSSNPYDTTDTGTYTLLNRTIDKVTEYGYSNLEQKYNVNIVNNSPVYTLDNEGGSYIKIYSANSNGSWVPQDNAPLLKGYYLITDWSSQATIGNRYNSVIRIGKTLNNNNEIISQTVSFTSPALSTGDQEINIYCADNIKYLDGLSAVAPKSLSLSNATKLLKLECHSAPLTALTLTDNTLLQSINLSNSTGLTGVLDIRALNNLRTLDLSYTKITGLYTNNNGGNLNNVYLGRYTVKIDFRSQRQLREIKIQGDTGGDGLNELINQFGQVTSIYLSNCPNAYFTFIPIYKNNLNQDVEYAENNSNLNQFLTTYGPLSLFRKLSSLTIISSLVYDKTQNSKGLTSLTLSLPSLISLTVWNSSISELYFRSISNQNIMFPGSENDESQSAFRIDANISKIQFDGNATVYLPAVTDWSSYNGLKKIVFNSSIKKKPTEQTSVFELILPSKTLEEFSTTSASMDFTAIKQLNSPDGFTGVDLKGYTNGIKMNFRGFSKITQILGFENIRVGSDGISDFSNYFDGCEKLVNIYDSNSNIFNFGAPVSIINSTPWTKYKTKSTAYMFQNCKSLSWNSISSIGSIDNNLLSDATGMFNGCSALTNASITWKNMTNLLTVADMFKNCTNLVSVTFSPDGITALDNMSGFLSGCSALTSYTFDTRNVNYPDDKNSGIMTVTSFANMFYKCISLPTVDMATWNLGYLTSMNSMCAGCTGLRNVLMDSTVNLPKLVDVSSLFQECTNLESVFSGITWKFTATNILMSNMFLSCSSLKYVGDFVNWDFSNVTTLASIFSGCSALKGASATSLGLDFSSRNFDNVASMNRTFYNCATLTSLKLPTIKNVNGVGIESLLCNCAMLKEFDTCVLTPTISKLTSLKELFSGCSRLTNISGSSETTNYQSWSVQGITTFSDMFKNTALSLLNLSGWTITSACVNTSGMFSLSSQLTTITGLRGLLKSATSNTNLSSMFKGCSNLTFEYINGWPTSQVTDFSSTFEACKMLTTTVGICDEWYFTAAKNISGMFSDCKGLTNLTLTESGSNGGNQIANASQFASDCTSLLNLHIPHLDFSNARENVSLSRFVDGDTALISIIMKANTIKTNFSIASLIALNTDGTNRDIFFSTNENSTQALVGILGSPLTTTTNILTTGKITVPTEVQTILTGRGWTLAAS